MTMLISAASFEKLPRPEYKYSSRRDESYDVI